jgi:hypothetical protein
MRVIPSEGGRQKVREHLTELAHKSRIIVTPHVIVSSDAKTAIQHHSADAAVVFLGMKSPEKDVESSFCEDMNRYVGRLQTVIFVDSAGDMSLES